MRQRSLRDYMLDPLFIQPDGKVAVVTTFGSVKFGGVDLRDKDQCDAIMSYAHVIAEKWWMSAAE